MNLKVTENDFCLKKNKSKALKNLKGVRKIANP